jgi:crotonobetainyl-CoA:carnitine CoA-transferase CaiB-like acyl-CoA transferase
MLADLGADARLVRDGGPDPVERRVLERGPVPVPVVGTDRLDELLDSAHTVVWQGGDPPRERLAAAGVNLVELTWPVDGPDADAGAQAAAGTASIVGEPDRPPLWFPHRMGEYILGQNACAMIVYLALNGRRGAVGELSLADLWGYATGTNGLLCTPKGITYHRDGRRSPGNGGVYPQRLFRAKDGWVALLCRSSREWSAILAAVGSPVWGDDPRYRDIVRMASAYPDEVDALLEVETAKLTTAELFERAVRLGFPLAPLREPDQVLADDLLTGQGFWADSGGVSVPASLWRAQSWRPAGSAAANAPIPVRELPERADLSGLRVLDLSWVWAGPMVGAFLADLGADVVKVEHGKRLDNMRLRGRLPSAIPEAHREVDKREIDPLFHNVNRGKRSMLLDVKCDEGRELFLRLVEQADVVLESFRPHVLDSWGLGYEVLKARNPRLVLLSLRGLDLADSAGATGLRSYAPVTSSLVGLESTIRYPDGDGPVGGMALGVSDPVAGWHGVGLALAALLRARRTGDGGWIKLSQLETLATMLTDLYLTHQLGLPDAESVTEGVGCADGDALVTLDRAGWAALTGAGPTGAGPTGAGPTDAGPTGAGLTGELTRTEPTNADAVPVRPVLTGAPGNWRSSVSRADLERAAGQLGGRFWPVRGVRELADWPALYGRRLLASVEHALTGPENLYGHGWRLDGRDVLPTANAPVLGVHTEAVLGEYLGLDPAAVGELRAAGVLS